MCALAGVAEALVGQSAVRTDDKLCVGITPEGKIASVRFDDVEAGITGPGGFSVKEVLPPKGEQRDLGNIVGNVVSSNGVVVFQGMNTASDLVVRATFTGGKFIDVRGEVEDTTGKDRAVQVTFLLPIKLVGWRWENTLLRGAQIEAGKSYPSAAGDMLYLGKKDDSFANEDPAVYPISINKLPLSAVTCRNAGLALAYPLHEPRVFMIRAEERGYSITFSLGLTAATEKFPKRAGFRFVLYRVDPQWGIRSALDRYYGFFPELFAGKAKRHGNFGFFFLDKLADRPEDFGFAFMENDFQWKNGEMNEEQAAVANRFGIQVVHWRNPWVMHTPPDEPLKADTTPEECLATLKAWAAGERDAGKRKGHGQDCGVMLQEQAKAAVNSHFLDEQGRFIRGVYDNVKNPYWVFPMNMDPDLPVPNRYTISTGWQYRFIDLWSKPGFRGPRAFAWDATDDFDSFRRLNFRKEHFRVVDVPLTFDPETGGLCQVKGFHDWEFASPFSRKVREAGGMVMANTTIEHSMMFLGSCIDVFIRERKIEDNDEERLSVMRALAGKKPVSFIGHWQPRDEAGLKAAFHKALLFGIATGAKGCSKKEADGEGAERAVFKTRMPVFTIMTGAGWEPVTHARADGMLVERFGGRPGAFYFAVRNNGKEARAARLQLDGKSLGIAGKTVFREVLESRELKKSDLPDGAVFEVQAGETLVISVMEEKP